MGWPCLPPGFGTGVAVPSGGMKAGRCHFLRMKPALPHECPGCLLLVDASLSLHVELMAPSCPLPQCPSLWEGNVCWAAAHPILQMRKRRHGIGGRFCRIQAPDVLWVQYNTDRHIVGKSHLFIHQIFAVCLEHSPWGAPGWGVEAGQTPLPHRVTARWERRGCASLGGVRD